jgi:hypothetical protein
LVGDVVGEFDDGVDFGGEFVLGGELRDENGLLCPFERDFFLVEIADIAFVFSLSIPESVGDGCEFEFVGGSCFEFFGGDGDGEFDLHVARFEVHAVEEGPPVVPPEGVHGDVVRVEAALRADVQQQY